MSVQLKFTVELFTVLSEFGTEDMDTGTEADSSMAKVGKAVIITAFLSSLKNKLQKNIN